ncbi:MAG: hypothetical protein O7D34_10780, partial [Ignavibacteria bacterium]|nr:hypothetical protein [Ignavibacteria bacterium]
MQSIHIHRCVLFVAFMVTYSHNAFTQDNIRNQLFGETDEIMTEARGKRAHMYGPTSFGKAMEYYTEADEYYKKGRELEAIRTKRKGAASYFLKAIDARKFGEVTFPLVMAAREDAISAGAQKYSAELWKGAETQFRSAA